MGHHLRARTLLIAFALAHIFTPASLLAAPNPAPKPFSLPSETGQETFPILFGERP